MANLGKLLLVIMLCIAVSRAQTLTSISIYTSSAQGYHINGGSGTLQLTAVCGFSNGTVQNPCSSVTPTWGSADTTSATVNSSGLVTSVASPPNSTLDIYAVSGTVLGHHIISLTTSTSGTICLRPETYGGRTPTQSTVIVQGTTVLLSAVDVSPCNAGAGNPVGDYVNWSSSNTAVATVNNIGEVTGISAGTATLTGQYFAKTITQTITVTSPNTSSTHTWFVRPDGGTRYDAAVSSGQCNGLTDAAYPGTGTNQPCAFSHPMYLFTDESSSTVLTPAMSACDTAIIHPNIANGGIWNMGQKTSTVSWVMPNPGSPIPTSGTPFCHTVIQASGYSAGVFDPPDSPGNRTQMQGYYTGIVFDLRGVQNIDFNGIDIGNSEDCQPSAVTGIFDFACQTSGSTFALMMDSFTSNLHVNESRIHGFYTNSTGTPGPGLQWNHSAEEYAAITGLNFDNPFGFGGNRSDGFTANYLTGRFAGCTEELAKPVTSVARASNVATVTFPSTSLVNYIVGTNIVLQNMIPADLNGTFPVASINFNQQTVNITGGTCANTSASTPGAQGCKFTTSAAPTFGIGSFVHITGETPSFLNGYFEVNSVVTSSPFSFTVWATNQVAGWPITSVVTPSSGGTASTANTLTFSSIGANESASTVGTAWHVFHNHRCFDQQDGAFSNGDNVGTGDNTIGAWICDHCQLNDGWQDGWDMLHSAMTNSQFTNSTSTGNEGAPAKFGNADTGLLQNNQLIANCAAHLAFNANFPADYNQYTSTVCRAADTFPTSERAWSGFNISNNTFLTTQSTGQDDSCNDVIGCTGSGFPGIAHFINQNNIWSGYYDTNNNAQGTTLPGAYACTGGTCPTWSWTNNDYFNVRNPPDTSPNTFNPGLTTLIPNIGSFAAETNALTWNIAVSSASSAVVGAGAHNAYTPTADLNGATRPNPPSIGAVEFGSAAAPSFTPAPGIYSVPQSVTITSSSANPSNNVQNSLTGWDTCILPGCNPGGTGTPTSTSQTINNSNPSLSGASMLVSMTVNANNTNALWSFFGLACDACTNFNVDYQVYPPTTAGLGALEYDQYQFSVSLNTEFMWGMQYCMIGTSCPGAHNSWDIWDQLHGNWIDTGITTAPTLGAWNHIQIHNHRVVGDTNSCSGQPCMHYDTFILNGVLHALNLTEPAGTLPTGFASGDGFQIQMDVASVSGSTTFAEYLDQATFSETPAIFYYTTDGSTPTTSSTAYANPLTISTSTTIKAIATQTGASQSSVGSATYTFGTSSPQPPINLRGVLQ